MNADEPETEAEATAVTEAAADTEASGEREPEAEDEANVADEASAKDDTEEGDTEEGGVKEGGVKAGVGLEAELDAEAPPVAKEDALNFTLDVFEGPLDLLLYLIKRDEVDIYDIPIVNITEQYMDVLKMMQILDLNIAGEFLVMASTLTLIKSRLLLPVEDRGEEDEEEEDPRLDLVRQLVEYRKFKDAAGHLEQLEGEMLNVFPRGAINVDLEKQPGVSLKDVSIFDLINAFNEALKRVEAEKIREIFTERYTVAEKIDELMIRIRTNQRVSISGLFVGMRSRAEIICTFLAVLELIKLSQITIQPQNEAFDEIHIERVEDAPDLGRGERLSSFDMTKIDEASLTEQTAEQTAEEPAEQTAEEPAEDIEDQNEDTPEDREPSDQEINEDTPGQESE